MTVRLEVSLGLWQDRPAAEVRATAAAAEQAGYPCIWVGEMATYDAFALATALGPGPAELVVGPLAVTVRDPAMVAVGAASVADLTGRRVSVALGTSSTVVVERWHGRSRRGSATALAESAQVLRTLLAGGRGELAGEVVSTSGYRLRLAPPGGRLVVAAFGDRALRAAVLHADQLVLNLVGPDLAARLVTRCGEIAAELDRPVPEVAVWSPAAVGPDGPPAGAVDQLRRGLVPYLAAPGYTEAFDRAGYGDVVARARGGAAPAELLAAVPDAMVASVGVVGTPEDARAALAAYAAAGVGTVVLVPASTDADPAGAGTLHAVRGLG
ncbi:LLM class F420-dependent oxidoreductase [Klenkia sp. PcliD-1-E]|uniref:LLM class F420-dependent oxidoreductase n=1 Tax=Klenkia sp. PcliD-1-E TaxID=2954492 RepID=UPI002096B4A3|nr:LLM class F420-dependent oxidoreductase [Klenkia sp. PcliD-1-E]MCO7220115.1 LLM class F420-dependent oxidoreductase [Klenkia sp. PcliD-1-E]